MFFQVRGSPRLQLLLISPRKSHDQTWTRRQTGRPFHSGKSTFASVYDFCFKSISFVVFISSSSISPIILSSTFSSSFLHFFPTVCSTILFFHGQDYLFLHLHRFVHHQLHRSSFCYLPRFVTRLHSFFRVFSAAQKSSICKLTPSMNVWNRSRNCLKNS